jgi:hypothetical protein
MALPKAIQAQVDAADALIGGINDGVPPNGDTQPPEITEPVAPKPPEVAAPAEPKVTPTAPDDTKWEAKFHSLKGKYDAEVPRMAQQLRDSHEETQKLARQLAEIQEQLNRPPAAPDAPLITDNDKEAFGPELIDLVDRAMKQNAKDISRREQELADKIKKLESRIGTVDDRVGESDLDRCLMKLSKKVPDWESINASQEWLTWLAEVDQVYGVPRQNGLDAALAVFDVDRLAAIFNAFKQLVAAQVPPAPPAQNQELLSQVAPTRSSTTPAPVTTDTNKRIWTQAQITKFFEDWRRGHIDEAQAVKTEAEISVAASEGRVK